MLKKYKTVVIKGKGKCYQKIGNGFFGDLGKKLKAIGKKAFTRAKPILIQSAKEIAPTLLTVAGTKALTHASEKGVPDFAVNFGNQMLQKGAKVIQDDAKKTKKDMNFEDKLITNFITDKSSDILGKLLTKSQQGKGLKNLGSGLKNFDGKGLKNFGSGLLSVEAKKESQQYRN